MPGARSYSCRAQRPDSPGRILPTAPPSTAVPLSEPVDDAAPMNILCFADTRFPIERANGVQTMATCHALASRGHAVTLVVRPDTTQPARDPFAFYGLPHIARLKIHTVPAITGAKAQRAHFLLTVLRMAL